MSVSSAALAGYGGNGGLGNGQFNDSAVPVAVAGGKTFTEISAGFATCALEGDGSAWCWGERIMISIVAKDVLHVTLVCPPHITLDLITLPMQEGVSMGSWAMGATMTLPCPCPWLATSSSPRLQLAGPRVGLRIARHGAGVRKGRC